MYFVCFDDKFLNVSLLLQDLKLIKYSLHSLLKLLWLGVACLPLHFKSWTPLLPEVAAGPGLIIVPEIVPHMQPMKE